IGVAERAQSQELAGLKGIGDESTGVSVVADMEGITFQVDVLLFRRGEVGAVAMTMCMLGPECLMDIRQVGEKLDKRIHVAKMLATLIAALRPGESRPTMPSPLTTSVPSLEGTAIIPTLTPKKTLFRLDIVEREESAGDRLVGTSAVQIRNPRDLAEVIGNLSDDEVVEVVERTENREFLRVKLVDRGGQPEVAVWAPEEASSEQTQLWHLASFPPPTPTLWRRATGLLKAPGWGLGELTVENGRNLDAVAVLTIDDTPVAAAYIRAGESYTIKGISEGTYSLYFNIGEDWSDASARFTRKSLYFRFEDTLTFRTTTIPGGMEYTTFRVTLHPMLGGTARTLPISAEQFPALR
ncbi:MAG: hypothetical protein ACETWB_08895, partial [Anaerolineae bacterium]